MMLRTVLIVAVVAAASSAAAQEAGPAVPVRDGVERLTLDAAIARGVENSQRLAELQARKEGAEAVDEGRRAAAKPLVALTAGYTRTNHVDEFGITVPGLPAPHHLPRHSRQSPDPARPPVAGVHGRAHGRARAGRPRRARGLR